MKHIKYTFIFLILSMHSFAQSDSVFNKIDSNGLKQGYWRERKLKVNIHYYKVIDSSNKICKINGKRYFPIEEGEYLNGQRVGKWIDYSDCLNYFTFNESVVDFNNETITDTSYIDGEIYLENDTVKLICQSGICNFITSNGKLFKDFNRENLEVELLNVAQCRYNSLIRKKKKNIH